MGQVPTATKGEMEEPPISTKPELPAFSSISRHADGVITRGVSPGTYFLIQEEEEEGGREKERYCQSQ